MSESIITKRALAGALEELMYEVPFQKISISSICDRCGMNRKSFYYHFKDKYDLVNWIFYIEFIHTLNDRENVNSWDMMQTLCDYMYQKKDFYRKALQIEGQNSFSDYFRNFLYPLLKEELHLIFSEQQVNEFHLNFYIDALFCAIKRWLSNPDCMPSKEFCTELKSCIQLAAIKVIDDMEQKT